MDFIGNISIVSLQHKAVSQPGIHGPFGIPGDPPSSMGSPKFLRSYLLLINSSLTSTIFQLTAKNIND